MSKPVAIDLFCGVGAMINVKNYRNAQVRKKKDLVPNLEELRKILDVCSI